MEYLETVMSTERIKQLAKRIGFWIASGYVLHWFFNFSEIAAILAVLATDLLILSPIAFFKEKNAYTAEMIDEMQQTIEQLIAIGEQNYDLATNRKISLEIAEKKLANLQRNLSEKEAILAKLQQENESLEFAKRSLSEKAANLEVANKSLSEKLESLKVANSSLSEKLESLKVANSSLSEKLESLKVANKSLEAENESLKVANKSLEAENESLKVANKSLVNRCNALQGVIKRNHEKV